ncbi:unnamed protein product [Arctia plantaginis]|uniref:Uncharacterized protein n=1 Tax=Arctia plantaginis TaxID=874455 RepID=A0A8S0Z8S4_ARCPL|nr:unnamed protein product [Arctia plantaginis]
MDSDWNTSSKQINGINFDNYIAQRRSYNSVVFVHKKYLEEPEPAEEKVQKVKAKREKKHKQEKNQDKCQQFTSVSIPDNRFKSVKTNKISCNNNTVLDQTIKFAKDIVPLIIPPDEDKSNVFYTIKTSKKHTRKEKKPPASNLDHHQLAQEQQESKKLIETFRKVKKESFSVHESISHSSSNTLEDLNIDQSLCCTFSEVSEKKYHKKDKHHSKTSSHDQKFAISESFEAVATENIGGDARIKIHLMNEKDKHFLSETIKEPVLKAIRNCILELNNNNTNTELPAIQKYIKTNSQKLDNILDKLTSIERKLESYEINIGNQEKQLNIHEHKLNTHKNKFDSHEIKLDSHEAKLHSIEVKLDSNENKFDSQITKRNAHSSQLNPNELKSIDDAKRSNHERKLDSQSKESAREAGQEVADKRAAQTKLPPSDAKSSTLEELGADLIEMDEEYTSEEELHQELLDRRSKSNVVIELAPKTSNKNRMESLGGGEVPPAVKGTSIGTKLERPNRIPARFCWTDTVRKN